MLPGFREIRAPLIAGYLWLIFAWVIVSPDIRMRPADPVFRAIYDLADDVGRVGVAVGVSVGAYLVGSVSQQLSSELSSGLAPQVADALTTLADDLERARRRRRRTGAGIFRWVRRRQEPRLLERYRWWVVDVVTAPLRALRRSLPRVDTRPIQRVERAYSRAVSAVDDAADGLEEEVASSLKTYAFERLDAQVSEARNDAVSEFRLPATVLVEGQPELFAEVDRLRAEGELRVAVVPPLLALSIALGTLQSAWWLLGIVPVAVLFWTGLVRLDQSLSVISDAITRGRIESRSQAQFEAWVEVFTVETLPQLKARVEDFDIIDATWGTERRRETVTDRLQRLVTNRQLTIDATNRNMGGDPDEGVPKVLDVRYRVGGHVATAAFKEGEKVILPPPQQWS